MAKPTIINIPQPCSENWDNMATAHTGRFCTACQKEVIDFTTLSDAEVRKLIKNNPGGCGMFLNSQLNRDLNPPQENKQWLAAAALAVGMLTLATPAAAQSTKEPIEQGETAAANTTAAPVTGSTKPFTLTGTVRNSSDKPLKDVTIQSTGGEKAKTNRRGKFSITVTPGETLSFYYKDDLRSSVVVSADQTDISVIVVTHYRSMGRYF